MSLADLLARGYFPEKIPHPFTTAQFATVVAAGGALPGDFGKSAAQASSGMQGMKCVRYSANRGGLRRRTFGIPNPLQQYLLSREIIDNWNAILPAVSGTSLSATAPVFSGTGRAIAGRSALSERPRISHETRLHKRYVLTTDITRFYPSIYTHSIAWALHSKPTAKANKGFGLLGNRLDFLVRIGQDRQTVGLPIGPDTSLVIAEMIMQCCDRSLIAALPNLSGFRFIDDYELAFMTRTEAEEAFGKLQTCLAGFELELNHSKTNIEGLPLPFEPEWVHRLRTFSFGDTTRRKAADLRRYFDLAFTESRGNPDQPVLAYAVARLSDLQLSDKNWEEFQRLLLLCAIPEPASFPYAVDQIIRRANALGLKPLRDVFEKTVNDLIIEHAPRGHSSEVAWALWTSLVFGLRLHLPAVEVLERCDDPVVAILALDSGTRGLTARPLDPVAWMPSMSDAGLYSDQWLLAYEANFQKWLPSAAGGDHVAADPNFGFLKQNGVSFYDRRFAISYDQHDKVRFPRPWPAPLVVSEHMPVSTVG